LRTYNQLIIVLALALGIVNGLMAWLGQNDIQFYFIADIILYLVITILYSFLNPRARNSLTVISVVFFAGLMVIIALKVIDILKVS
jgi:hypothetical protein